MRLGDFVGRVVHDPVFRRALRYQPAAALAEHGLSGALAPDSLPVKHYEVQLNLSPELLFGLPQPRRPIAPSLDLRWVRYGARPMALLHGPEFELTEVAQWARERQLFALLSPAQFSFSADTGKGDYANYGVPEPAVPGSGAWRGLLVSPDLHHVLLGWLSLLFRWDGFLGRLLGYPKCCVEAFQDRWPIAEKQHQGDLAPMLVDGLGPHNWSLNPLGRYFGAEYLAHFPCSLQCEASMAQASRQTEALQLFEPETLHALRSMLARPYLYTDEEGVFCFEEASLDAQVLSYTPTKVLGSVGKGALAQALVEHDSLRVQGEHIKVGDLSVTGKLAVFEEKL